MVSSSQDAIRRVVEAFERSDWSEIDVRSGNVRVHLSTSAPTIAGSPALAPVDGAASLAHDATSEGTDDDSATGQQDRPAPAPADPPPAGAHVVASPVPGIFWRSPEPGLPPFADVGDTVDASATVCIIEVMKLMNHVKAAVGGQVVAVYGQNGVAVQKGQALFAIVPDGSTS